jgi:hypothetical protein
MTRAPTKYEKAFYVTPADEDIKSAEEIRANGGNRTALDIAFTRCYERYGSTSSARNKSWGPNSVFIRGEGGTFHEYGVFRPRQQQEAPR